jgi:hypothetical protein
MRHLLSLTALTALIVVAGCGSGGDGDQFAEGHGKVRDSDGLHIITVDDAQTGLRLELQDDSLYLKTTAKTKPDVRDRIRGQGLAGQCEGAPGKSVPGLTSGFQIYWREQFGDWGSAVVRLPERKPSLADELKTCRIFAEGSSDPIAEIDLR